MASGVDPSADASQQLALVEDLLAALSLKHDVGDLFQHLTRSSAGSSRMTRSSSSCWAMTGRRTGPPRTRDGASERSRPTRHRAFSRVSSRSCSNRTRSGRGLQSGLEVPVKIDDQVVGVLALFSRRPAARIRRATSCTPSGSPTASASAGVPAACRAGPRGRRRAPSFGRDRNLRRAAPHHLRRPRHPHGVSEGLGARQQDAAARRVGHGLRRSGPSLRAPGGVAC